MRAMTDHEMRELMDAVNWGTLCAVSPESRPYAIELTYVHVGDWLYGMIRPNGTMAKYLQTNPEVCFKVCDVKGVSGSYRAMTLLGTARIAVLKRKEEVHLIWSMLETRMSAPGIFDRYRELSEEKMTTLPILEIAVRSRSGICSE